MMFTCVGDVKERKLMEPISTHKRPTSNPKRLTARSQHNITSGVLWPISTLFSLLSQLNRFTWPLLQILFLPPQLPLHLFRFLPSLWKISFLFLLLIASLNLTLSLLWFSTFQSRRFQPWYFPWTKALVFLTYHHHHIPWQSNPTCVLDNCTHLFHVHLAGRMTSSLVPILLSNFRGPRHKLHQTSARITGFSQLECFQLRKPCLVWWVVKMMNEGEWTKRQFLEGWNIRCHVGIQVILAIRSHHLRLLAGLKIESRLLLRTLSYLPQAFIWRFEVLRIIYNRHPFALSISRISKTFVRDSITECVATTILQCAGVQVGIIGQRKRCDSRVLEKSSVHIRWRVRR